MHASTECSVDPGFDGLGYHFDAGGGGDSPGLAEAALWCAVIEQAFVDVGIIKPIHSLGRSNGPEYDSAMRWLTNNKNDFYVVCGLAGVKPEVIRGRMREERLRGA